MEAQGGTAASGLTRRSSKITLGWVCSSESKERSRGEGLGKSQETEGYRGRGEEEENVGVSPITLRWGARGRDCPIGGDWRILDHGI